MSNRTEMAPKHKQPNYAVLPKGSSTVKVR